MFSRQTRQEVVDNECVNAASRELEGLEQRHALRPRFASHVEGSIARMFDVLRLDCARLEYGRTRIVDAAVMEAIRERIARGENVRCLEIGAGATYGGPSPAYGCPWLARLLAKTFPDRLTLTASDLSATMDQACSSPVDAVLIAVADEGRYCRIAHAAGHCSLFSAFDPTSQSLEPVSPHALAGGCHPFSAPLVRSFLNHAADASSVKLFIRPTCDPQIESSLFGLSLRCGVDYYNLPDHFPGTRFDVIFARNLEPDIDERALRRSLAAVLAQNGQYLVALEEKVLRNV